MTGLVDFLKKRAVILRVLGVFLVLGIFAAALVLLHVQLSHVSMTQLRRELDGVGLVQVGWAVGLTCFSYVILSLYDIIGLRYVGKTVSFGRVALASFSSYTISHSLGASALTGGSMRYRVYSQAGLTMLDVAALVVISGTTFFLGGLIYAGAALVHAPAIFADPLRLPPQLALALGWTALGAVAIYLMITLLRRTPVVWRGWSLNPPGFMLSMGQIGLALADIAVSAAVLYVLLPHDSAPSLPMLVGVYAVAVTMGVLSHVPGGLGVFEAVMLAAFPAIPREEFLAALLAYRLIYYVLPLGVAMLLLAIDEFLKRRHMFDRLTMQVQAVVEPLMPPLAGGALLITSFALLLSGATPADSERLTGLSHLVPLQLIEISHVTASLIGVGLAALAYGLFRRVRMAETLAGVLLMVGIIASLLKGWDFEEALMLAAVLGLLRLGRGAFYRRASLVAEPPSPLWLTVTAGIVLVTAWIGFLSYRHVPYAHDLWLHFSVEGNAPRFLRATFAVLLAVFGLGAMRLFRPVARHRATSEITPQILSIVATAHESSAQLALTGDKRFFLSADGDAFIMYQAQGTSWLAMGDPVGPSASWPDLLWAFRDEADRQGARAIFYEIGPDHLPYYLDMGLKLHKLGEESRVDLCDFTLAGPQAKDLRHAMRKLEAAGGEIAVVAAADVPPLIDDLRAVSDDWLEKRGKEKGFSVGFFHRAYLERCDIAVVRIAGRIVAFANLLHSADLEEGSVDMMRWSADAPSGTMKALMAWLCLRDQAAGYRWFNLGMAPLAGMETHRLAPLWHKFARFAFLHGDRFYSFSGLAAFKAEFRPVLRPRYIAISGPLALPQALIDAARLIERGEDVLVADAA